jgi:branched-chain amino acid transport system permease protein
VSDDRQSAALVGIDPELVVVTTFALAGALAAVGAVVLASRTDVRLDTGVALGVQAFVAAVLGGLGSARGALVGGYGIGFTLAIAATISSQGAQWGPIAVFVLFLTVLAIRPAGLLGSVEVERA